MPCLTCYISMHMAYQNVHLREYIISFHCIIFIRVHLDARNVVRRGLLSVSFSFISANALLSFLPCLMCAWYDLEPYMSFIECHVIFTGVYAMYLCDIFGHIQGSHVLITWALHEFCYIFCHLSRGATHVFLWCVWWLAQAFKVVHSLMLISGT